jgi:gephyrin
LSSLEITTHRVSITATDSPGVYKVLTRFSTTPLPEDTIYRINTGSPLPPGTDAVIMVEDTQLVSTDNETEEEAEVETLARIPVGENVRLPGSDVRRGDNVMLSGDKITGRGGEVGSLVFVGREKVCFLSFGTPRSCSVDEMST